MLKKDITYVNYNGTEKTDTFYFNLNVVEITELEASFKGGLEAEIRRMVAENDTAAIVSFIKNIILKSYGEKTMDGNRFKKSPEISEAFSQTEAFAELFTELCTNLNAMKAFVKGIIPQKAQQQIVQQQIVQKPQITVE